MALSALYSDSTTEPKYCSKCGCTLRGTYFDYGGRLFCALCFSEHRIPPAPPSVQPQPNYTIDWLKENARLTDELKQAQQQIAEKDAEIARLKAQQITPAMHNVYQGYISLLAYAERHDTSLTWSEESRFQRDALNALCRAIDPERWPDYDADRSWETERGSPF